MGGGTSPPVRRTTVHMSAREGAGADGRRGDCMGDCMI